MKLDIFSLCVAAGSFTCSVFASSSATEYQDYLDTVPVVLQYRQAYYEVHGHVAPKPALPVSHAWPNPDTGLSYKDKLTRSLPLTNGIGAEIGPLTIPILLKTECQVLYVDHLDTESLRKKYPDYPDLVPIDRPIVNNSLKDTLSVDAPLDFLVASQVLEHVPNPIRWLQEIADVLRVGGLVALSLPDRRLTFDFFREETRPADIVSAYLNDIVIPDVRSVYDHHSLTTPISMHSLGIPGAVWPNEVVAAKGAIAPPRITKNLLEVVHRAHNGEYLDIHCWVFTPPSFLLMMAQLAGEGFLRFKCHQFYPTNPKSPDRSSSSFTIILEKVADNVSPEEIRRSFLAPLGD